ncbi:hypothetical protein [Roseovarius ramblicola]|uniref:Pentapeptide repeats (8 copies) n=1 Tax=Roseovarius ramblicola TaxID=2022336 RepID=A0ABV5HXV0_9RHOB
MRLADFGRRTEAEQAVIAGLGTGHVTKLGDGHLPGPEAGEDRQVRASLIRWLALGAPGDDAVRLHETGLRIAGALVVSDGEVDPVLRSESTPGLDLEGCRLDHGLSLLGCRFQDTPVLRGARLDTLNLQGSHLPGFEADGLEARGDVFLDGVQAEGEVRLLGARIGDALSCTGGRFVNPHDPEKEKTAPGSTGDALSVDRLDARGSVFLRGVQAVGEVRLSGARIGGNLECDGGRFENAGGRALSANGARVAGVLFWRQGSHAQGALDLTAAEIGHICDDPECWPATGELMLNRCRYGAFTGTGTPVDSEARIRWLDRQDPAQFGDEFWPQAWEHCAQVLREMGHAEDARAVLIAKEERQRRVRREIESARLTGARLRKRLEKAKTSHSAQASLDEANSALNAFEHSGDPRRTALADEVMAASLIQDQKLREKGGDTDAILAQVAAKAERLGTRGADATLAAQSAIADAWTRLAFLRVRDGLLALLIAYGHRPLRALGWLAGMWILGAVLFGLAWGNDGFKPNNAFILSNPEWAGCYKDEDRRSAEDEDYRWKDKYPSTLKCFLAQPEADGYPGFNGLLYSLDTLVPVVDLEVQDYWVPDEKVAAWARVYLWGHIGMGWFLALLAVAGFSGLIDTRATKE